MQHAILAGKKGLFFFIQRFRSDPFEYVIRARFNRKQVNMKQRISQRLVSLFQQIVRSGGDPFVSRFRPIFFEIQPFDKNVLLYLNLRPFATESSANLFHPTRKKILRHLGL